MSDRPSRLVATTPRLVLRRFDSDDLDVVLDLDSDPEVLRFADDGQPVDRARMAQRLQAWLHEYGDSDEGWGCFAAESRDDGRFLGWFHLRPSSPAEDGVLELGYRLRRDVWRQGLATEGSRALIDLAFRSPGVQAVRAETLLVHTASRRVMEKCGMRLVRTFTADWPVSLPGSEHGDVEYAIARDEWRA